MWLPAAESGTKSRVPQNYSQQGLRDSWRLPFEKLLFDSRTVSIKDVHVERLCLR
jgi:hypothetical protein